MIRILAGCLDRLEAARGMSATLASTAGEMLTADRPQRVRELAEEAANAIVPDSLTRVDLDDTADEAGPGAPSHRELVLPLAGNGQMYGRITVESPRIVPQAQRQALLTLAAHASSALEAIGLRSELHRRANHDPLTELANRGMFAESLVRALAQPERRSAVIFIDLDDFKSVNDGLSHAAGDTLLKEVADRLRRCVRTTDLPARVGGDEFAVLVNNVAGIAEATAIADRLLAALEMPVDLGSAAYRIRCSIGIATSLGTAAGPTAVRQADELLSRADAAMYEAKAAGKNRYMVFDAETTVVAR